MDKISDLRAIKEWKAIPKNFQQMIKENVYCMTCGTTCIEEGFTIKSDKPYGITLQGKCKKCGAPVARFIESE